MEIKLKLNNPLEESCLGIHYHRVYRIDEEDYDDEEALNNAEILTRVVLGFIVFSIEILG